MADDPAKDNQPLVSNDVIQDIFHQLDKLNQKIDMETYELNRKMDRIYEGLSSQIGSINGDIASIVSAIRSLIDENSRLKTDVGDLESAVSRIDGESKSIKRDLGSLQGRFTTLESGTATLKGKVETLEKGNYDSRLKTIETSIQKIPILEGNVKNNTDRVEALEKKVGGKIKDLEVENGKWKEDFDTYWKEHGEMITDKDGKFDNLKHKWDADKIKHEQDITGIKADAKKIEEGLNQEIKDQKTTVNELETQKGILNTSLKTTETDRDNWKSRFEGLEKQYMKDKVVQ